MAMLTGGRHRRNQFRTRLLALAWVGMIAATSALRAGEETSPRAIDYAKEVKPLLNKRCYACHGALKRNAGLRLDTVELMMRGGDGGPAIEAGNSEESLIVEAVIGSSSLKMPPEGEAAPFSPQEIALLRGWIDQGAKAPPDEKPQPDPRKHWSFRPPVAVEVPHLTGERAAWVATPIDAFLAKRQEERGLTPRPSASPRELIRRIYLDLIGILPTDDDVRAFADNPSESAYEAIVDRLLASPQYGERWGRHWMDIWRYSDWDGFGGEIRESQPHIWHWRDWIVESLNTDRPYDQMIVQMLAADEATPDDPQALRATGYLVRNWYKFNRNSWLDATIEHTAKAFLALTLNCARCHDHKYDPVSQADYYRFRAFFEPHNTRTDRLPGQPDTTKDGLARVYDAEPAVQTFLFTRGDERRPVKERPLSPGVPTVLERQVTLGEVTPITLPTPIHYPGYSPSVQDEQLTQARTLLKTRQEEHDAATKALAAAPADGKAQNTLAIAVKALQAARSGLGSLESRIAADRAKYAQPPADAEETQSLARSAAKIERLAHCDAAEEALLRAEITLADAEAAAADPKAKADEAKKAVDDAKAKRDQARADLKTKKQALTQDNAAYSPLSPVYPATTTGRRLALANWIANRKNPLTARVAINHLWMRHFGASLVPSEFDFGVNGRPATHPELLDWLAVAFMDGGWRMKPIHRMIVMSRAYRMQSYGEPNDPNLAIDPANRDYWRMNPRRMEAEAVRDNLFRVAGNLDLTLGGPDLDPESGLTSNRRSIYFRHAKEKRVAFLRLFDSSNVLSCYRRSESVVPQQALALANSSLSYAQARLLAGQLATAAANEPADQRNAAFVDGAFERILGRQPTVEERTECAHYLAEQAQKLGDPSKLTPFAAEAKAAGVPASSDPAQRARESLVHVLLNHNDFLTIR